MTPARFASALRFAAVAMLAAVLAACGGTTTTRPTQPSPPPVPTAPTTPVPPPGTKPATPAPPVPDKGDPQARFKAALDLMKQKKSAEAEAAFFALTKDFPNFSGPMTDLGILYDKSNRRDAAIAAFTKATTLNPNNASAYNWLGIANREAGRYEAARQAYEKALQIKPNYPAAELNLGLLLDDYLKRPADAVVHYKNYDKLMGGNDLRVLPWIAEIEARQMKPGGASAAGIAPTTPPAAGTGAPR